MPTIEELIAGFTEREEEARMANITRMEEAEAIWDRIISMYGPGGTYGAAAEALLEKQKVRDVGATAQRDITRGLYGIRPYEQEWEATVGAKARLGLEDIKSQRLAGALTGKASYLEKIEQPYPDYSALIEAVSAQAEVTPTGQLPTIRTGGYGTSGVESQTYGTWTSPWGGVTPATGTYGGGTAPGAPAIEMGEPIYGAGRDVYGEAAPEAAPERTTRQLYEEYKAYAPYYTGTYEKWARDHATDAAATVATAKEVSQRKRTGAKRTYGQTPGYQGALAEIQTWPSKAEDIYAKYR